MTNNQIILAHLVTPDMTDEQVEQMVTTFLTEYGEIPYHTAAVWSRRGYSLKADAEPEFECYLWKHTDKISAAMAEALEAAGEDVPDSNPHFYQQLSAIYSIAQVEKVAPAPDLATLKARLDALDGVAYKVKGEKTGSPNVWITAGAEEHTEAIKALGGVWSRKKSAYWIKPRMAA